MFNSQDKQDEILEKYVFKGHKNGFLWILEHTMVSASIILYTLKNIIIGMV
jgi:hypothetical protein